MFFYQVGIKRKLNHALSLFPPFISLFFPLFLFTFPLSPTSSLSIFWRYFSPKLLKSNFLQQSFLTTLSTHHTSRDKLMTDNETFKRQITIQQNVKMMRRHHAVHKNNREKISPRVNIKNMPCKDQYFTSRAKLAYHYSLTNVFSCKGSVAENSIWGNSRQG